MLLQKVGFREALEPCSLHPKRTPVPILVCPWNTQRFENHYVENLDHVIITKRQPVPGGRTAVPSVDWMTCTTSSRQEEPHLTPRAQAEHSVGIKGLCLVSSPMPAGARATANTGWLTAFTLNSIRLLGNRSEKITSASVKPDVQCLLGTRDRTNLSNMIPGFLVSYRVMHSPNFHHSAQMAPGRSQKNKSWGEAGVSQNWSGLLHITFMFHCSILS